MPLPFVPNTTCDIFRSGAGSPASAGIPCLLISDFVASREHGKAEVASLRYTHRLRVGLSVDVRDDLSEFTGNVARDVVWIPDQHGTPYLVTFVERLGRGTTYDHLHIYLDRTR